jgi:hypothetical protein
MDAQLPLEEARSFRIFQTIKLGVFKTADEYRHALEAAGHSTDVWSDQLLARVTYAQEEIELDLAKVSVRELGYSRGTYYGDICVGLPPALEVCPAEVGPALRLAYTDQPRNDGLRIAMEPIIDSDGDLGIFYLLGKGFTLSACHGDPERAYYLDHFVFVRRRPSPSPLPPA